jgi:hypothetical protein
VGWQPQLVAISVQFQASRADFLDQRGGSHYVSLARSSVTDFVNCLEQPAETAETAIS